MKSFLFAVLTALVSVSLGYILSPERRAMFANQQAVPDQAIAPPPVSAAEPASPPQPAPSVVATQEPSTQIQALPSLQPSVLPASYQVRVPYPFPSPYNAGPYPIVLLPGSFPAVFPY